MSDTSIHTAAYEQLEDEFVRQFAELHGGAYTQETIRTSFRSGYLNKPNPNKGYHAFLAWQAGRRHGGW